MKTILSTLLISLFLAVSAQAQVTIFQDDFSTNTVATDYVTQAVTYNATPETVTIARSPGSNFLQIADAFTLDAYGATELSVSFDFSFGGSMFGSGFTVQYNDGTTGWQTIASQNYTGTGANDLGNATNTTYSVTPITINEGATYAFTDAALIRIIGTTNSGSKGYTFDNLTISVDAVPEPSSFALISGFLALTSIMLRRRR